MDIAEFSIGLSLSCERPVALASPDHKFPWGTLRDNSRNRRFNQKLYRLFGVKQTLAILDVGCSGGGFVRDCFEDGHLAIGLKGSDYSKRHQRAEWATIPQFLYTCDVTAPFTIARNGAPLLFDAITSWEFIEHIAPEDLGMVAENIGRHLLPGGIWILSVSPNEELKNGVRLHQTVQPEPWWVDTFKRLGWRNSSALVAYFNTQFVRGPKYGAPGSFNFVLRRDDVDTPIPLLSLKEYALDVWLGSGIQRLLSRCLPGLPTTVSRVWQTGSDKIAGYRGEHGH